MSSPLLALAPDPNPQLPPILAGHDTPALQKKVECFYSQIAEIFESWVQRRKSPHTQRAYREDVMNFVQFLAVDWPKHADFLVAVSIQDVQAWGEQMLHKDLAPRTLNRRIASLSSFYKYLAGVAGELRLPITVPNPAHAQFIARESTDARDETKALTASRARQLMNLLTGDSVLDCHALHGKRYMSKFDSPLREIMTGSQEFSKERNSNLPSPDPPCRGLRVCIQQAT